MTTDELIDGIIEREGGYTNDPADKGGATNWGITAKNLGKWRKLGRPATAEEVKALTIEEAREIYRAEYVAPFNAIPYDELKAQLVDFGVLSGVTTAIIALQRVLGVAADGILGDRTKHALVLNSWRMTNNALVAMRVKLFVTIVSRDATQRRFFYGWTTRAVRFLV